MTYQYQRMNKLNDELYLNGSTQSISEIVQEMNKAENACLAKLHLTKINAEISAAIFSSTALKLSLKKLDIHDSCICSAGAQTIINFIVNSALEELRLSECTSAIEQPDIIIDLMAQLSLKNIIVHESNIQRSEAEMIAKIIEKSSLTKLSFTWCTFQENGLGLIMDAVMKSTLQTLRLRGICVSGEEIVALADCIENSKLIKLVLFCVTFRSDALIVDKQAMLTLAMQKSTLQILDVRRTRIFSSTANLINIIGCTQITRFKFNDAPFNTQGIIAYCNSIKGNPSIKNIYLEATNISDDALRVICDLIENSTLTHLALIGCGLSREEQVKTLIGSIKKSTIVSLNLNKTLSYRGNTATICDLLENHNLQKINIGITPDEVLRTMLPSIKKSSLIKMHLVSRESDVSNEIREMLPSIKKSSLVKMHLVSRESDVSNEIREIMAIQKGIMYGYHKTKSAMRTIDQKN